MDYLVKKYRFSKRPASCNQQEANESEESEAKQLSKKAGFISIKERVSCLAERQAQENRANLRAEGHPAQIKRQSAPQYANLYELFSSRSGSRFLGNEDGHNQGDSRSLCQESYKPRIPVMKLSKDDWNVKCWEDRLSTHRLRQQESLIRSTGPPDSQRGGQRESFRLERRTQVFRGRIDDVASKLDKVRVGLPMDEKLFELSTNRLNKESKNSHEWTDMLKEELKRGTHNSQQLRSQFARIGNSNHDMPRLAKTGRIGRPIRKLFHDDQTSEYSATEEQPEQSAGQSKRYDMKMQQEDASDEGRQVLVEPDAGAKCPEIALSEVISEDQ